MAGRLFDLGPYPGAVLGPEGWIQGELARLPDDPGLWAALDRYEGFVRRRPETSLFRRVRCRAEGAGGGRDAWIYVYNRSTSGFPELRGGRYPPAPPSPGRR